MINTDYSRIQRSALAVDWESAVAVDALCKAVDRCLFDFSALVVGLEINSAAVGLAVPAVGFRTVRQNSLEKIAPGQRSIEEILKQ